MAAKKKEWGPRPEVRGQEVVVRCEDNDDRPLLGDVWSGTVLSVKLSPESGWWFEVMAETGMVMVVPQDRVEVSVAIVPWEEVA